MNLGRFNEFCSDASSNGILFYYTGEFTQNVVATLGDTVQQHLQSVAAKTSARRKVFSAFVEMAQNILHYGEATTGGQKIGALAVGEVDGRYFVVCGNPVRVEHMERLRGKLEPLRAMTLDEIKEAYRQQLRNDDHDQDKISRGSGLGFLTVARESSAPIEYQILQKSGEDEIAEFYLRATI